MTQKGTVAHKSCAAAFVAASGKGRWEGAILSSMVGGVFSRAFSCFADDSEGAGRFDA